MGIFGQAADALARDKVLSEQTYGVVGETLPENYDAPIEIKLVEKRAVGSESTYELRTKVRKDGQVYTQTDELNTGTHVWDSLNRIEVYPIPQYHGIDCIEANSTCWQVSAVFLGESGNYYLHQNSYQIGNPIDGDNVFWATYGSRELTQTSEDYELAEMTTNQDDNELKLVFEHTDGESEPSVETTILDPGPGFGLL